MHLLNLNLHSYSLKMTILGFFKVTFILFVLIIFFFKIISRIYEIHFLEKIFSNTILEKKIQNMFNTFQNRFFRTYIIPFEMYFLEIYYRINFP